MLFFSRTPLLGFFLAGFEAETTPGCSLPNAKTIQMPDEDKTVLCYANMGKAPHRDAAQICQDHDARLPLPTSDKDNRNLIHLLKLIGITEVSYWNRIILDTTDSAEEGKLPIDTSIFNFKREVKGKVSTSFLYIICSFLRN